MDSFYEGEGLIEPRHAKKPDVKNRTSYTIDLLQLVRQIILGERIRFIQVVNAMAKDVELYASRQKEAASPSNLPFELGIKPFQLPEAFAENLDTYGEDLVSFYHVADRLYYDLPDDHRWKRYLDHSKSDFILEASRQCADRSHPFIRPDFILNEGGATVAELETSPFGLGLSHFLNTAYAQAGLSSEVNGDTLVPFLSELFKEARAVGFITTDHTKKFKGQLSYLAAALQKAGVDAMTATPDEMRVAGDTCFINERPVDHIYRGFYLHEAQEHPQLKALLTGFEGTLHPPCKPHLEEKALMGLLYDQEMRSVLARSLGNDVVERLMRIIPPTFVLDPDHLPSNFPREVKQWEDIATLKRRERQFVVKPSGFSPDGSWAKGVTFLHTLSRKKCFELIGQVLRSPGLFVIQEFRKGKKFDHEYYDFKEGDVTMMTGKVRFTPYFSTRDASLITAKATLCPNTDFIHASSSSINVPVK